MTDLNRFTTAGMILGGCPLDGNDHPVDSPGWIGRFADVIGIDRGNLSKILAGQRVLSPALEDRLDASIRAWRDREVKRLRVALLIAGQIDAERQAQKQINDIEVELDDDPAPQIGG